MIYLYRCANGHQIEFDLRGLTICDCGASMRRDYQAENVGLGNISALRKEREAGGRSAIRDLFLPQSEDFAGPKDPDGEKGMQTWLEEHGPRESNTAPLYPEHKRKSF